MTLHSLTGSPIKFFSMGKGTYRPRIDLRRFSFFFASYLGSCYILELKCNVFEAKKKDWSNLTLEYLEEFSLILKVLSET